MTKDISDVLTVSFDSGLKDEAVLCVARKYGDKTVVLKTEYGEQADILYHLLTEQLAKAEITEESEKQIRHREAIEMGIRSWKPSVTAFADKCKECGKILNEKLQMKWIPVSERLPNFNDIVLATAYNDDYDELRVIIIFYSGEEFWFDGKIKAWMPLPEPYKAKTENKIEQGLAYTDQDTLMSAT